MTLRGTLKGQEVILDAPADFPEGTPVEVIPIVQTASSAEGSGLCGIWEDPRPAAEIVRDLRSARTGFGGRKPSL